MGATLEVKFNFFPEIARSARPKVARQIKRSLDRVTQGAKDRSRVDTGEMRDGWHVEMENDLSGAVVNEVPHTIFNEYGTRKMSAQPMIRPAIEAEREDFEQALNDIITNWSNG